MRENNYAEPDVVVSMRRLLEQQREDYGDSDGFDAYEHTVNECIGSPSEALREAYLNGDITEISDGPIYVTDSDGRRLDDTTRSEVNLGLDGRDGNIKILGHYRNKYEGPLGTFEYDTRQFAVGYKEIGTDDVPVRVPALYYVGAETDGSKIDVPAARLLNYTFEGHKDLMTLPAIKDGTVSMFAMFKDCTSVEGFTEDAVKSGAAKLPDSVENIGYACFGCSNLSSSYNYVSAYSHLRNMDGFGLGTMLPKKTDRGINMDEMLISRELRGEDIPVILDSSGYTRTMPHRQDFFEENTSKSSQMAYGDHDGIPTEQLNMDEAAVVPSRVLATPDIPAGDYLKNPSEVYPSSKPAEAKPDYRTQLYQNYEEQLKKFGYGDVSRETPALSEAVSTVQGGETQANAVASNVVSTVSGDRIRADVAMFENILSQDENEEMSRYIEKA